MARPKTSTYDASTLVRHHATDKGGWDLARREAERRLPAGERLTMNDWIVAVLNKAAGKRLKLTRRD